MAQTFWIGSSGCLLPSLIIFNLIFGKLIFSSTRLWLGIEAVLVLIFIMNINIITRRFFGQFDQQAGSHVSDRKTLKTRGKIVDIQGDVVEDNKKPK